MEPNYQTEKCNQTPDAGKMGMDPYKRIAELEGILQRLERVYHAGVHPGSRDRTEAANEDLRKEIAGLYERLEDRDKTIAHKQNALLDLSVKLHSARQILNSIA